MFILYSLAHLLAKENISCQTVLNVILIPQGLIMRLFAFWNREIYVYEIVLGYWLIIFWLFICLSLKWTDYEHDYLKTERLLFPKQR